MNIPNNFTEKIVEKYNEIVSFISDFDMTIDDFINLERKYFESEKGDNEFWEDYYINFTIYLRMSRSRDMFKLLNINFDFQFDLEFKERIEL